MSENIETATSPKTSFLTDAWKRVKDRENGIDEDSAQDQNPKRDAVISAAKKAVVLGGVIAATALITLKLAANKTVDDEIIDEDETDTED
jgi:hypothetical protein